MTHSIGLHLHAAAEAILAQKGIAHCYTSEDYLVALSQAEEEIESDVPRGSRLIPDSHGLEGHALALATNEILAGEDRLDDADRFLEIFSILARRSALYGYTLDGREDDDAA